MADGGGRMVDSGWTEPGFRLAGSGSEPSTINYQLSAALHAGERVLAIGLMSGTSADGIDAAAVDLWQEDGCPRVSLRAFVSRPYPEPVREQLFRCFEDRATVREVCLLNALIGDLFAM